MQHPAPQPATGLRASKGRRIAQLAFGEAAIGGRDVLDFGAGDGAIAQQIQQLVGNAGSVVVADVENRLLSDAITFLNVDGTALPVEDATFDLVISNHVLEHVGDAVAQGHYLDECRRVLRPGGALFLALPNRWTLLEPHHQAPLLSWLPTRWRSAYLGALLRLGVARPSPVRGADPTLYDCRPLGRRQTLAMLRKAGFDPRDASRAALLSALEAAFGSSRVISAFAATVYALCWPIVPVITFVART